jgi:hypothetical protein
LVPPLAPLPPPTALQWGGVTGLAAVLGSLALATLWTARGIGRSRVR